LCNRASKRVHLEVICKTSATVDLDDRQPLAVLRLERFVAADVDLAQDEAELGLQVPQSSESGFAEVTPLRVVDDDLRDKCRG
jgi:hypothetical protein